MAQLGCKVMHKSMRKVISVLKGVGDGKNQSQQ